MTERTPESIYYEGFKIEPRPVQNPEGDWRPKASIWLDYHEGIVHIPIEAGSEQIYTYKNEASTASLSLGKSWIDIEVKGIEYRNHNILFFPSRIPKKWKAKVFIYKIEQGRKEFLHLINPDDHPDEFEHKEDALQYYVSLGKDWVDQVAGTENG